MVQVRKHKKGVNKMSEYIIWQPGHRLPPTVTFPTRQAAIKVAVRMANAEPGKKYCVCKIVGVSERPVVVTATYKDIDGEDEKA